MPWRAGQTIAFSGHATDPDDGPLPATSLDWSLVLQHCATPTNCHAHPVQDYPGIASGSFVDAQPRGACVPRASRLPRPTARASRTRCTRRLDPETIMLSFASSPSGLALSVGTETSVTPFQREVIRDASIAVSAPSPQSLGVPEPTTSRRGRMRAPPAMSSWRAPPPAIPRTTRWRRRRRTPRTPLRGTPSTAWGTAETGGAYSLYGNVADYDVTGTAARSRMP